MLNLGAEQRVWLKCTLAPLRLRKEGRTVNNQQLNMGAGALIIRVAVKCSFMMALTRQLPDDGRELGRNRLTPALRRYIITTANGDFVAHRA